MLNKFIITLFFVVGFTKLSAESRLPNDIELERLLLAAEEHITNERFPTAIGYLERAKALDVALPNRYYYFTAQYYNANQLHEKAYKFYEDYVLNAGKKGEFYKESLMALNTLEPLISSQNNGNISIQKGNSDSKMSWVDQDTTLDDEQFLKNITKLYMLSDKKEALVAHINSLLVSSPYTGHSPLQNFQDTMVEYSLVLSNNNKLTINKVQQINGSSQILAFNTSVFGLSGEFDTSCDASLFLCSIKHKDNFSIWYEISYNPELGKEIARSTSLLIQEIQRNSKK